MIIVDEAHALAEAGTPQNPYRTQRTRLGFDLRDNARGLLLLTATPHNGYPHSFRSLLALVDLTCATFTGTEVDLRRRVSSAMIRRLKAQILRRLPDGSTERVFPPRNVQGIGVVTEGPARDLLHKVASYCSRTARAAAGSEEADLVSFAMQIVKKRVLSSRAALAKTLEHRLEALRTIDEEAPPSSAEIREWQSDLPMDEATAERTALRLLRTSIPKEEKQRKAEVRTLNGIRRLLRALSEPDPKIEALLQELRAVFKEHPNDKVIVFTEYLDTLYSVRDAMEADSVFAESVAVLRGGMSRRQRVRVQDAFEGPDIRVLLATDAASEGLNLQRTCHRVFHFELPWNPNRLEQRNGRVDRYGQKRPPEIRYLYFPDSPEDDVLHRLANKIERMREDQVATPDILGVLQGDGELEQGLLAFDPEGEDLHAAQAALAQAIEARTSEFVRTVKPLVTAAGEASELLHGLVETDLTAKPLFPEDEVLEGLLRAIIGPESITPTGSPNIYRIAVPLRYRGPGVAPLYHRAAVRRSAAVNHLPEEVEFLTPLHPLVRAIAAEARRRFVQVYPDESGLPPRRLSARTVPATETPSVVFTFLGSIAGGGGLLEERLLAVRLSIAGEMIEEGQAALQWFLVDGSAGDVKPERLNRIFSASFDALFEVARTGAVQVLSGRARELTEHRKEQADLLRRELEVDVADRLREIAEEERRARGLVEGQQYRLFAENAAAGRGGPSRRATVETMAKERRREIEAFEVVVPPAPPIPLGALFLVPEEPA